MQVYATDGKLKFSKDFNIPYTTIRMSDGYIIMYNSSQICVLNQNGTEKYFGNIDGTVRGFLQIRMEQISPGHGHRGKCDKTQLRRTKWI